jgi:hypothetical protein
MGVAEAQKLGLYDLLMEKCAHEQPFIIFGGTLRDYRYFYTALVVEDLVVRTVFALGPEADT